MCDVEIHVHQSQLNEASPENSISSNGAAVISPEVTASLMKDKFLVTAITLEEDSEDYFSQSKLNELLKVINLKLLEKWIECCQFLTKTGLSPFLLTVFIIVSDQSTRSTV